MPAEHLDVLIVGAGLSGIGAACHLQRERPGTSFAILEARDAIGGTWDLFRYPGIRSDSDMFTLGYSFQPWTAEKSIADGSTILDYIRRTAREYRVTDRIRFHHKVVRAEWSSEQARWTVQVRQLDSDHTVELTCRFLYVCSGYYRYDEGYTPAFPGADDFAGQLVHPQHWNSDVDYAGKRVVVIGSGATAVTLVPALAERAAHVTMLQRSPSYILSLPAADRVADALRPRLPAKLAYPIVRWKNVLRATLLFQLSRRRPEFVKSRIRKVLEQLLPAGYDIDKHFTPSYNPWDQRICFVPDGDLFRAIRHGQASVVTDTIDTFTEHGIRLTSGAELEADVIVTATGLNLLAFGGMSLAVDGVAVDLGKTVAYKGMMISGVPNFAFVVGYTNASWTLKADLVSQYVCRVLGHMARHGYRQCVPVAPDASATVPLIDLQSGYVRRSVDSFPKQGSSAPWRLYQNYPRDIALLRRAPVEDDGIRFSAAARPLVETGTSR
ncbi:MAG TPA: NAD(P)/FAD-dependent oxidoreductase [Pseudonocardiaceae bacterium]|jgi:cation diffusion facilitator CzcD-associated flavoprotein CzcO|nr:NAD(P)/FAD-dependent oxidoreductase [Pseudonocardiaceae bacterium]